MDKLLLKPHVIEGELVYLLNLFFFYHNFHYTEKNKKYYNHQVLLHIFSTWEKGKKLKQSEIEVKMILKMKEHNLCSNGE